MKTKNILIKLFFVAIVANSFIFQCHNFSYAIEKEYSHNLYHIDFEKTPNNDVFLNVYTSSGYKIKIKPIKRSNGKYVVILPETFHSITSKPDLTNVKGFIKDVDVKLLPYIESSSNNGYTKITIVPVSNKVNLSVNNRVIQLATKTDQEIDKIISSKEAKTKTVKEEETSKKTVKAVKKEVKASVKSAAKKNLNQQSKKNTIAAKPVPKVEKQVIVNQDSNKSKIIVANKRIKDNLVTEPIIADDGKKDKVINNQDKNLKVIYSFMDKIKYRFSNGDKMWVYLTGSSVILLPLFLLIVLANILNSFKKQRRPNDNVSFNQPAYEQASLAQEEIMFEETPSIIVKDADIEDIGKVDTVSDFEELSENYDIEFEDDVNTVDEEKDILSRDDMELESNMEEYFNTQEVHAFEEKLQDEDIMQPQPELAPWQSMINSEEQSNPAFEENIESEREGDIEQVFAGLEQKAAPWAQVKELDDVIEKTEQIDESYISSPFDSTINEKVVEYDTKDNFDFNGVVNSKAVNNLDFSIADNPNIDMFDPFDKKSVSSNIEQSDIDQSVKNYVNEENMKEVLSEDELFSENDVDMPIEDKSEISELIQALDENNLDQEEIKTEIKEDIQKEQEVNLVDEVRNAGEVDYKQENNEPAELNLFYREPDESSSFDEPATTLSLLENENIESEEGDIKEQEVDYGVNNLVNEEPQELKVNLPVQASNTFDAIEEEDINVLSQVDINETISIYLINFGEGKALVADVNSDINIIYHFEEELTKSKLVVKYMEQRDEQKVYIIRVDNWRALVGITDESVQLLMLL